MTYVLHHQHLGLMSGVEGKGVTTTITKEGLGSGGNHSVINVEMEWPRQQQALPSSSY